METPASEINNTPDPEPKPEGEEAELPDAGTGADDAPDGGEEQQDGESQGG